MCHLSNRVKKKVGLQNTGKKSTAGLMIVIEAKASWNPGASEVISVFWVTEPGCSNVCMMIEEPQWKCCLRVWCGWLGTVLLSSSCSRSACSFECKRTHGDNAWCRSCYIYSHTCKLKRSLRTGSTGKFSVSWWHLHGFLGEPAQKQQWA